ncbi:MAG: adenylosuccinate lyase [Pseudomonadota bacterium]
MIQRYARDEMADIWVDESKYQRWLSVELAVCDEWSKLGRIPESSLKIIKEKVKFDLNRMNEIENDVGHDVIAFLTTLSESIGAESRYIHLGMTSSDLLDTAFATQLRDATQLILSDIGKLLSVLKEKALAYKMLPMVGRTHGIHAEPVTLGLKFALWYAEFERHWERLKRASADVSVGKISGAVGTFAHIPPQVEEGVCKALGLTPSPASTQVVPRDRHANFFSVLAGIASSIESVAIEIRHLQRTEVSEVAEPFGKKQKGSSAMPHKRNPILCENITGLARLVRSYASASLENVALWHERDISHSSVERVIAPDATILVDFMLDRLIKVLSGLDVFPERMKKNLELGGGLIHSQRVLLALVDKGLTREEAYVIVQDAAMKAWNESLNFKDLLMADDRVTYILKEEELIALFDLDYHFRNIDTIFQRVFGQE